MIKPGDVLNLKNGRKATVTRIGLSDFIGEPYQVYFQYIEGTGDDARVVTDFIMSSELKEIK